MKYVPLFFALCVAAFPPSAAAQVKIDIGPKNDRKDVLTKDAENWIVTDGPASTQRYGGVTFSLRPGATGGTLAGALWKGGIDTGATLATDGVIVKGAAGVPEMQLTLSGLSPGRHALVTFHNFTSPQDAGRYSLAVNGTVQVPAINPPHRTASDYDAATAYVEFEAVAGQDVVLTLKAERPADTLILNGLLLDGMDPARQIAKPLPAANDEHATIQPTLSWRAAPRAVSHDVYFGTSRDAVAGATHAAPEFKGNQKAAEFATTADDPWQDYFWRVDEINADNPAPVKGEVFRFRVQHLAFPEAEGYGRFAIGGRGGKVLEVTNLNDAGPGSLRAAVDAEGPRMIVFRVGGTIMLKSKLVVSHPYCTIAGQTAPGDGILLRGWTSAAYGTHDVILRYLRVRIGDENITLDGTGLGACDYSIMDHCSVSWSIDESFSSRGARNITLQRSLITEALNMSIHDHYVGTGKGHSFAGSISGDIGSFHHNLIVNCAGRVWSLAGGLNQAGEFAGQLDIRNNIVYNWIHRTTDGGVKKLNFVNNYYIPGPATTFLHLLDPDAGIHPNTPDDFQRYYMAGNVMEGHPEMSADNWANGGTLYRSEADGGPGTGAGLTRIKYDQPFFESHVKTDTAQEALKSVLADVGANIPHWDSVDQRNVDDVKNRTTHAVGSKTGAKGVVDSQKDSGGFPEIRGGTAPVDTDHDGIPDDWELAHGLDPKDPADGARKSTDGYSNLELYLNSIRPQ